MKTKDGIEIQHGIYTVQAVYKGEVICSQKHKTPVDMYPVDKLIARARKWIKENLRE